MALRKKIVQLAKMIGGPTGIINKIDENAPEYYGLAGVVSDEMAEVALGMGLRKFRNIEEIAARCGKPVDEAYKLALQLSDVGICKVFNREGKDVFMIEVFAPGVLELMVANREQFETHPEIGRAFEEYTRKRLAPLAPLLAHGAGLVRVLPAERALEGVEGVKYWERISYWLDKSEKFAIAPCMCRATRRHMDEGCGHLEHDMCLSIGETAAYNIRTGKGREISREEAKRIVEWAEDNGFVHEAPNLWGNEEIPAICNCCNCSCFSLRVATMMNAPDVVRSNFYAVQDNEKCAACGVCVEICPTNARKLGQKLCAIKPLKIKAEPSPRDRIWSEKYWNIDYRENRQDVDAYGSSPCKAECPAHISVQGYIRHAAEGRYRDALELIKRENPFPAVCGRICPHACESACTRGTVDAPIAIDEIKKFIADCELNAEDRYVPGKFREYDKKLAVIGSGPAGLSCAYYAAVQGYQVTVFEKEDRVGGMMTLGIPSFRLEKDVVNAEIDILRELGVTFKTGVEVGKDVSLQQLREQGYVCFYLAIGAQGGRALHVPGEDAQGVLTGIRFLKDVNLGKDVRLSGNVVVIGGGNVAIDVARTAIRVGANSVHMYALESREEMPALPEEIEEAEAEGIVIHNGWGPKEILAENGHVHKLICKRCVSVFDENHRFSPKYDEDTTVTCDADTVLVSIGQSVEWGRLLDGTKVELKKNGTAVADPFTYQTGEADLFVGGDAFTGPKFAIDAIAAGKEGAVSLHRFAWPGQSQTLGRDRREYRALDTDNVEVEGFDNTPRQISGHSSANSKTFRDDRLTFTEEQLKKETDRCLGCGGITVDEQKCLGCGLCVLKCKFDAIKLIRKYDDDAVNFDKVAVKVAPYAVTRTAKIIAGSVKRTIKGEE